MTWHNAVERWLAAGESYRAETSAALVGEACAYCGDPAQTFDHVVPRVAGGADSADNLLPVCRSCNGAKSGLSLEAWADKLRAEVQRAEKRQRALRTVEHLLRDRAFRPVPADQELDAALGRVA